MKYSAKEIVQQAKAAKEYKSIPEGYWIACVRRSVEERKSNQFECILNLMKGEDRILTTTCTTVPGLPALKGGFKDYNKAGAAVVKAGVWMNEAFSPGKHNGTMDALRQVKDVYVHRDNDMDDKAEELGQPVKGMWNTNIHASTYNFLEKAKKLLINGWSYGCIVCNYMPEYKIMIDLTKRQKYISAIVLDEFSI